MIKTWLQAHRKAALVVFLLSWADEAILIAIALWRLLFS